MPPSGTLSTAHGCVSLGEVEVGDGLQQRIEARISSEARRPDPRREGRR
jgi:hypothetical protein